MQFSLHCWRRPALYFIMGGRRPVQPYALLWRRPALYFIMGGRRPVQGLCTTSALGAKRPGGAKGHRSKVTGHTGHRCDQRGLQVDCGRM